jgi:TetR/AcrR family transcriptional regulator, tetracycline repressor protein
MLGMDVKPFSEESVSKGNGNGREPLSRDRICEVALDAIDEGGLEWLSMRTLAGALGVKASSLYYYFGSKEELLTGVAEFLYRKLGRPPQDGEWADQLKGTFLQLHEFVQGHPNAAPLLLRDLAYSPVAKKRASVLLRLLCRAGLDPEVSASLISNLVALLVGHTLLAVWVQQDATPPGQDESEAGVGDGDGAGAGASRVWVHKVLRAAQAETRGTGSADGGATPVLSAEAVSPLAMNMSGESSANASFLAGLDALIAGFAQA